MTAPTFFTVVADFKSVVVDLASDVDPDPQLGPVTAKVTFTPVLANGDLILATNATPRPTMYVPAPIVARIDADGRLKLRVEPDGDRDDYANLAAFPVPGNTAKVYWSIAAQTFYRWDTGSSQYIETLPYAEVRLLADTALLELATDLYYKVAFSEVVFNGAPGYIAPFVFQAPTSDTELNLVEVARVPGQPAVGITKIAPGAVRAEDGNLIFSFGGVDLAEPVPYTDVDVTLDAADISDGTATGRALIRANGAAAARTAINVSQINVLDYIVDPSNTATHKAGFQAAINAAVAGSGNEIVIPAGDWYVEGLVIPKKCTLKISGCGASAFAQRGADVSVTVGTRLIRTGNLPVFIGIGGVAPTVTTTITDNNVAEVGTFDLVRDVVFEDLTLENQNASATTPLMDFRGASSLRFNRLVLFSTSRTPPLLHLRAVMDSKWFQCVFLGGGISLKIFDGSDTYWGCNALWFNSCNFEYYGISGVDVGDENSTHPQTPRLLRFSDHKQEGWDMNSATTGHIVLRRATGVMFTRTYIAHMNTTVPIVQCMKVNGVYGDIGFIRQFTGDYAEPSARISTTANTNFADLDIYVHSGPDSSVNVITQADTANQTIDIRVNGLSQKVNGSTRPNRYDEVQTVFQRSAATTCQYVFDRTGLNKWALGNPANPAGDQQLFSISASDSSGNTSQMFKLISYSHTSGSNPATATYRQADFSAFLNLSSTKLGWVNFQNLVTPPAAPVGGFRLYAASGRLTVDGTNLALATDLTGFISSGGALGTPSSGTLTNCTFPTLNQNTSGTAAGLSTTLVVGSGGTGATTLTGLVKGNGTSAMTAAVAGTDYLTLTDDSPDITAGENTMPRQHINVSTLSPGNGNLRLTFFVTRKTETITSIRTICNIAQVGATLARIGIYSVDGSGNLTLVASTANDTTLWNATGAATRSLSASLSKVRGQRYAIGVLVVGTSTSPQLSGNGLVGTSECAVAPRLCGFVGSQTDLPASVAVGSVSDTFHQYYAALV